HGDIVGLLYHLGYLPEAFVRVLLDKTGLEGPQPARVTRGRLNRRPENPTKVRKHLGGLFGGIANRRLQLHAPPLLAPLLDRSLPTRLTINPELKDQSM